jgi:hypothetical protein
MYNESQCKKCKTRGYFIWALLFVIALLIVTVYMLIFGYIGIASHFAEKYGPNEVTCTLCEGVNEPSCVNLSVVCHNINANQIQGSRSVSQYGWSS